MNLKATIFCEGKTDEEFLVQFIKKRFNYTASPQDIQPVGGKTNLHLFIDQFKISTDQGLLNLVIFDADDSAETSIKLLMKQKEELGIDFSVFLFPKGDTSGDLEVLLELIAHPENNFIFECFEDYLNCLSTSNKPLKLPIRKTKIFAYLDLLKARPKVGERNYRDESLWNLNSDSLIPLYDFLNPHFTEE